MSDKVSKSPPAAPREDGLKPWFLAYYFRGGAQYEIVYALTAGDAWKASQSLPTVHSVRRATEEHMSRAEQSAKKDEHQPFDEHEGNSHRLSGFRGYMS